MKRALAALPAFAIAFAASAQNPPPTCGTPPHTRLIHSLRDLDAEVRSALLTKTPDIVDSNQSFDSTDVVMHGAHFDRFAFAWQGNGRWIVATEHGGIAYSNPVYTIVKPTAVAAAGKPSLAVYPAHIVNTTASRPGTVCADAQRVLSEKLPPGPPVGKPQSVTK